MRPCPYWFLEAALSSKPDYAILLGRPSETEGFIELCLEGGTPFMAEKPASLSAKRLFALAGRCEAEGLFNASPFCLRWDFAVLKALELLGSGALGRVASVYASYFSGAAGRYRRWGCPWVLEKSESGGGAMFNVGLHALDMLRLWGFAPSFAAGRSSCNINSNDVDDVSSMLLELGGGAHAVVESGYLVQNPCGGLCFSINAEKGNLDYRFKTLKASWADGRTESWGNPDPEPRPAMQRGLIKALLAGEKPASGLGDVAFALSLCEKLN